VKSKFFLERRHRVFHHLYHRLQTSRTLYGKQFLTTEISDKIAYILTIPTGYKQLVDFIHMLFNPVNYTKIINMTKIILEFHINAPSPYIKNCQATKISRHFDIHTVYDSITPDDNCYMSIFKQSVSVLRCMKSVFRSTWLLLCCFIKM